MTRRRRPKDLLKVQEWPLGDSNPDAFRHKILSLACLPFHQPGLIVRVLRREGELGVVAAGALADLLVVDGDPLADVTLLAEHEKHLLAVMKGGEFAVDRLG